MHKPSTDDKSYIYIIITTQIRSYETNQLFQLINTTILTNSFLHSSECHYRLSLLNMHIIDLPSITRRKDRIESIEGK